jgi:oxygen-independent coproporphyrinogen-3 oxidase
MRVGLYIHIPFCKSKCHYCDFTSFAQSEAQHTYIEALQKEIAYYGQKLRGDCIHSIFIGGGTPTVLSPFLLEKVLRAVRNHFIISKEVEWTIEANPGTITKEHAALFAQYGVTRVSLGLQAVQKELLSKLGRIHSFEDWVKSLEILRQNGIHNINTDLMFALPNQTLADWEETLKVVCSYPINHISAYALIIEEGTPFYEQYEKGNLTLPDEQMDRKMYEKAKKYLEKQHYHHYETSNWAKARQASRHNLSYWTQKPYIGMGLGAHSYFGERRWHNPYTLEEYNKSNFPYEQDVEKISLTAQMEEYLFLRLRLMHGISKSDFYNKFGTDVNTIYKNQIQKWVNTKAMIETKQRIYLSSYGMDISNTIFSSFL